jgi:signal transduction histidine kinase
MQNLRISIATDLHDDIGATLSSISMYSDALKNQIKEKLPQLEPVLDKMGKNSRDMVSSMSDIVWAINPDNDEGKNLVQRMEQYARDLCAIKIVKLQFNTDDGIKSLKVPLEKRKNIYLVFKEALNNALKYSQATEIDISLRYKSQSLQLVIKDNGKGFDIAQQNTGNGLKNMQSRAREINASIRIGSEVNEGTTVEFECEL